MGQSRVGFLSTVLAVVIGFSFVLPVDAKSKANSLQTYQWENMDHESVLREIGKLTNEMYFLQRDFVTGRQEIMRARYSPILKKHELKELSFRVSRRSSRTFLTLSMKPFYDDKNMKQSGERYKEHPEIYRAWFRLLVAKSAVDTDAFEIMLAFGESTNAHRVLSNILESGNAQNIVYLSKQARLHAMAGNMAAARDIVQKIQVRQQRENPVALYLPDYAAFIWNRQELQTRLASAQQAYRQEQARLQKLGL